VDRLTEYRFSTTRGVSMSGGWSVSVWRARRRLTDRGELSCDSITSRNRRM
jgi:hypothetical protein